MKLPIKKKYFDEIKSGKKSHEFRDAHLTLICEETGEILKRKVIGVGLHRNQGIYPDVLDDDYFLEFRLSKTFDNVQVRRIHK